MRDKIVYRGVDSVFDYFNIDLLWFDRLKTTTVTRDDVFSIENINQINTYGDDDYSLFMYAVKYQTLPVVEYFLERNADVNYISSNNNNALFIAIEERNEEEFALTLLNHSDVNVTHIGGRNNMSLLLTAIHIEKNNVAKKLIDAEGTDLEYEWTSGIYTFTPLIAAVDSNELDIVKRLVGKGAIINKNVGGRNNALKSASSRGYLDIVQYLVGQGANIDMQTNKGRTALIDASLEGHLEVVQYLVANGANINMKTNVGRTALIVASLKGHLEIVKHLFDRDPDAINMQTMSGDSALTHASEAGHVEIVRYLVGKGAKTNLKTTDDDLTALILASGNGHLSVVQILVEGNANLNLVTKEGNTALMHAVSSNETAVVEYLLEHGARPNIQNIQERTALDLVRDTEIESILNSYLARSGKRTGLKRKYVDENEIEFTV